MVGLARWALLGFLLVTPGLIGGCATTRPGGGESALRRWRQTSDYYALLELVDRHIDPAWNRHVSKADVVRYLGQGIQNPNVYPHAGPDHWVYTSSRAVPTGSYLYIDFGPDGLVQQVDWGSE